MVSTERECWKEILVIRNHWTHLYLNIFIWQSQMDVSNASVDNLDTNTTQDLDDIPLKSYSQIAFQNAPRLQHSVVCGVCSESVLENKWIDHIRMEHKYLAWKSGEPPLVSRLSTYCHFRYLIYLDSNVPPMVTIAMFCLIQRSVMRLKMVRLNIENGSSMFRKQKCTQISFSFSECRWRDGSKDFPEEYC